MGKFTGKNREVAKWLGEPLSSFDDPGFCLACGESECVCDLEGSELEDLIKEREQDESGA